MIEVNKCLIFISVRKDFSVMTSKFVKSLALTAVLYNQDV